MRKLRPSNRTLSGLLKMKERPPPFPLIFLIYCVCTGRHAAGFPQPFAGYLSESGIPKSERLALCFSQWIELSDQPQVSSSVMDLCNSMFNSLQIDEENNQEIYKRFLFHYSRAQDPTYPLKDGSFPVHPLMNLAPKLSERRTKRVLDPESQVAAAEFTKKDGLDALGRPFFLFRVQMPMREMYDHSLGQLTSKILGMEEPWIMEVNRPSKRFQWNLKSFA